MFLFKNVSDDQKHRTLAKLRWLRTRLHIVALADRSSKDGEERWYRLYTATDRLDPAPEVTFGTAGWEYMRYLAQIGEFSPKDEQACAAVAACYLAVSA